MSLQQSHGFELGRRLRERERATLRRDLAPVDEVSARAATAEDPGGQPPVFQDEQVVFAANNYLGLAGAEQVAEAAATAARDVGAGAGASRLIVGDTPAHRSLERTLAEGKSTERALAFSSGYAANVGTITALDPDIVFSDDLNHASIIDGARLSSAEVVIYDHCDPDSLAAGLADCAADADAGDSWLAVTDSVFSMDGDVAPIADICDVAQEYGAWVMVDEVLIEHLLNIARAFVFSTGLAPPAAAAAEEAISLAPDCREALWTNVEQLRDGLESMGYEVYGETHILPVIVGDREDAVALDERLRAAGIAAPAVRPPTVPDGTSRTRLAPQATHMTAEIDQCLAAFEAAGEAVGLL